MEIGIHKIFILLLFSSLFSLLLHAMNPNKMVIDLFKEGKPIKITADIRESPIELDPRAFPLSGTINLVLNPDLETLFIEEQSSTILYIPLSIGISNPQKTIKQIVAMLNSICKTIKPRTFDNQYSAAKIKPIINKSTSSLLFKDLCDLFYTSEFLDIPLLLNALAHEMAFRYPEKTKKIIAEYQASRIAHQYLAKQLTLYEACIIDEKSISDVLEQRYRKEKRISPGLFLENEGITSLAGIEKIPPHVKKIIGGIYLSDNNLLDYQHDPEWPENAFDGFNSLVHLSMTHNLMTCLPADMLHGLHSINCFMVENNYLRSIPNEILQCKTLKTLHFEGNPLKRRPNQRNKFHLDL